MSEDKKKEIEDTNRNDDAPIKMSIMFALFVLLFICVIFFFVNMHNLKEGRLTVEAEQATINNQQQFVFISDYYDKENDISFKVFYDKDTLVKYLIIRRTDKSTDKSYTITPLYNADGTLQLYNLEEQENTEQTTE